MIIAAGVILVAKSIIQGSGWKLAGTTSSETEDVSYPANARELYVVGRVQDDYPTYTGYIDLSLALSGSNSWMIGGYYTKDDDCGEALVQLKTSNRTVHFRSLRYSSKTGGKFYVYYR